MTNEEEINKEARRLLEGIEGTTDLEEGAIAIKMMVDNLVEAGMERHHALFWSAIHVAALARLPDTTEE